MQSDELQSLATAAWAERSGTDPSSLLVDGADAFAFRTGDGVLTVTSHVTGSSYEHELPVEDEVLLEWLDEVIGHDVVSYRHEPE
jgi:hypothetical protein